MKSATFSDFRNNARRYFDAVELGESIEIYRNGKLIAVINPVNRRARDRWKKGEPLMLNGVSLSAAVLADRKS